MQDERALAVADALEAARGPISLAAPRSNAWSDWWLGSGAGAQRIALVAATDGHFASVVAFERARALNPWLGATSHSFSFLQPMAHLVEQLNAFAPTVLASYPSMAWVLSEEQRAGRLKIAPHAAVDRRRNADAGHAARAAASAFTRRCATATAPANVSSSPTSAAAAICT